MEQILNSYYKDNARKLRRTVDKILSNFGGLSEKDLDDFYSLANEVFADVIKKYDRKQSFDAFLYSCLFNRIKTEMSKRNREKRKADRFSISIDIPVSDDEDTTLGDTLVGNVDIESEVFEKNGEGYSERMMLYLNRLSGLQRDVLRLTIEGYFPDEIKAKLHINGKQYTDCNAAIRSYRNVSVLF